MTLDEFDNFTDLVLSNLNHSDKDEYWGTDRDICEGFLTTARAMLFGEELQRAHEYELYLELKAKFDPKSDLRTMETLKSPAGK